MKFKTGRITLEIRKHGKKFLPFIIKGHPCCKGKPINIAHSGEHVSGMSYSKALRAIHNEAHGLNGASKAIVVIA